MNEYKFDDWEESHLPEYTKEAVREYMDAYLNNPDDKSNYKLDILGVSVYQYIRLAYSENYIDDQKN